jgi:NTE family protein
MTSPYDTLVLSGNSTNAIYTLGALLRIKDKLDMIQTYVGTSSGAMIVTLLAIGYEPIDILSELCYNKSFDKIGSCFNLIGVHTGSGIIDYDIIESEFEKIIIAKLGYVPTLCQVFEQFGRRVITTTYNLTDGKKTYVDYISHPHLLITNSVHMSCAFPFIFKPFEYQGKHYIDGGVTDNFPMKYAQSVGYKCIGLCNSNRFSRPYIHETATFFDLLFRVFSAFICSISDNITLINPESCLVRLEYEPSFFNFNFATHQLITMFDMGYTMI